MHQLLRLCCGVGGSTMRQLSQHEPMKSLFQPRVSPLFSLNKVSCFSTNAETGTVAKVPSLTIYTREVCPLCEEAKNTLKPFLQRVKYHEVDITHPGNAKWFEMYNHDVPVIYFENQFLMKHKVDVKLLEKRLQLWAIKNPEE